MSLFLANSGIVGIQGSGVWAGPTYEGSGAIADASGASFSVVPPTHQVDDILILQGINGANGFFTAPGWTLITDSANLPVDQSWLWKRATSSSETATLTPSSSSGQYKGIIHCFRGCISSGTPFEDATSRDEGSTTHPSTASIDTTGSNRLAVSMSGHFHSPPTYTVAPPPAGWDAGLYSDSGSYAFTLIQKEVASASNVPAIQIGTVGGTPSWASVTLAFIPA